MSEPGSAGGDDDLALRKRRLRRRILDLRDSTDPWTLARMSERIRDRVMALPQMASARTVHLFASFGSEPDTFPLIEEILGTGRRAALPVVDMQRHELRHCLIGSMSDLVPGYRGIREPCEACSEVQPRDIDLVIVPGVAFDRQGRRMGYGGGFYDRFLGECPAPRIAMCFGMQVVEEVPAGARDLPVDLVVTESGEIRGTSRDRS